MGRLEQRACLPAFFQLRAARTTAAAADPSPPAAPVLQVKGTSKEDAQKAYIALVTKLLA